MGFATWWMAALLAAAPAPAASSAPAQALAATPQFRHYGIDQGLPNSNVYKLVQDHDGVIWMGTITGVARFNGTQFKAYRHIPGDSHSLAADDASAMLVDHAGRLWVGGENNGVNLYQPETDSFRHFKHHSNIADSLAGNDVMAFSGGRDGTLWVGIYGHGLDHMTSPGHFQHLTHDPDDPHSLPSNNVLALYRGDDGRLWIGTDKGLDVRMPDGHLKKIRFADGNAAPTIWSLRGDHKGIRVGTSTGLYVIGADGVARRLLPDKLPRAPIMDSARDHHGNLWLATTAGLWLVHDHQVTTFPARPLLPGGQPGQIIWNLLVDAEGGLWLGTRNGGVAYLRPDWRNFSHYVHRPDDDASLSHSHVLALAGDGHGGLWVGGGRNQLDHLDPSTGAVVHHGKELGKSSKRLLSMTPAGSNGLWVASSNEVGLLVNDHLRVAKTPPHWHGFQRMTHDRHGNLYVSSVGRGVCRIDRHSLAATRLQPAFPRRADLQTSTLLMHEGELWRASHAGVSRLPHGATQLKPVAGIDAGEVDAMAISGQTLWLVRPHALEHYRLHDHHATRIRRIDATHGWPGIITYALTVDARGRVWLFGGAGLWRYDPDTRRFKHYRKQDGLPSQEFTTNAVVRTAPDTIFAGTMLGVVGFHPADIHDHAHKPRLKIRSISVHRHGRNVALPTHTRHLHLGWRDRDLTIKAQALSYLAPKRDHYRFFLSGLDQSWVDTGTHGVRELAGLHAGHYRLKVEAAGPAGVWASLRTPLRIDVDAPPWQRPWAWAGYALFLLAVVWLAVFAWRRRLEQRHRMQLAQQQRRMAEQASAAKTRFLATLSHEIRTPMTGVLGTAEMLLDADLQPPAGEQVKTIHRSGSLLLKLLNEALDTARIEAGHVVLEPASMDIRMLLEQVRQLQSGQALKRGLALTAHTDADVPEQLYGDAARIKQILLNLVGNALKFTEEGGITLTASYRDGNLQLMVRDTGPGISDADRDRLFRRFEQVDGPHRHDGTGLGLAICHELATAMGGHIELETALGRGSCFRVSLPLPVASAKIAADAPHDGQEPAKRPENQSAS